jgi:hypothetical protein
MELDETRLKQDETGSVLMHKMHKRDKNTEKLVTSMISKVNVIN